ncbi:hypothetical protein [Flagellimonas marinaquae]|uniref:hypothetical protein n=1 Tax=Flagellimonas marinaquae TaxID=254955 RepID=UPI000F8F5EEB|nr:hypothetical protein [Allomuricauda aquimarina]
MLFNIFRFIYGKAFLILLLVGNIGYSQTEEIDSLQNLLKTADDTTQVNLLRLLEIKSRFINKEKAVAYGLQSLEKSKEIGFFGR